MRLLAVFVFLLFISCGFCSGQGWFKSQRDDLADEQSDDTNTVEFRTRNSLVIVPVKINDTLRVMLAIDPHCTSIVLFGKKYERLLAASSPVSTLLPGKHSDGPVSLHNKIAVGPVVGENVPILVVPNSNPLNFFTSVHGVMGSHFFSMYDLHIDHKKQTLTFTPAGDHPVHLGSLTHPRSALDLFIFD
jgi:hypothetical protein